MPYLVALLVSILLILGSIGYWAVDRVSDLTTQLYEHPYTVSTALLRINSNVINMDLALEDLLRATTLEEIKIHRDVLDQTEDKVLIDFQLVKKQFLGEPRMVQEALQSFLEWKKVREELISLTLQDKRLESAAVFSKSEGQQLKKLENKINVLLDYAENKARGFYFDAQETRTKTLHFLLISFMIAMVLANVIFRRAVQLEVNLQKINEQLEDKVAERTTELSVANEEMNAMNEEIRAMNEELFIVNEKLEMRVEERTSELVASYQELKATEEELRVQFENLREMQRALYLEKLLTQALFDSVPGMLYLYDDQGKLVRWNKKHEEMTGYSPEELLGMDLLAWFKGDKETTAYITKAVQRALWEGFADAEADLERKDGTKIIAYFTAVPLKIDGKAYFAGIGIDIAERSKAKEEILEALEKAENANRAKSQFLANMSHEIRTPLNGIIGMTDLTLMTDLEEEQREYLTVVKSSTISLLRVLNDILDYSKVEAGKIELEKGLFDLQKTLYEVTNLFDIGARQKGLSLTLKIDKQVPNHVIGDSVRLRQVLSNLVGNGIKFTYQGQVLIAVEVERQYDKQVKLRFTVTDTGIGIAEDKLDKLFKRFSQVDDSNTREFGGTGLGLAISKKLIDIMGGEIGVESKENVGSNFFFTAIFEIMEVENIEKDTADHKLRQHTNKDDRKILLAEDDAVSRNMVTIMLKQRGFEVIAVENGMEAISAFEKNKFDAILMDINMPYKDGYSATTIIRSREEDLNYRTPIIAMTAYALKGDRERCLEVGMDDYISKPINLTQTMDIIERYIKAANIENSEVENNREFARIVISLMEHSGLNRETSQAIVAEFCRQAEGLINGIRMHISKNDLNEARVILHKLKGSAGNVRAKEIAKQAMEAEEAIKMMDIEKLDYSLQGIEGRVKGLMKII